MDEVKILDLKGNDPIAQVNVSRLGSGSPNRQIPVSFSHKRVKHSRDEPNPKAFELQVVLKQDITNLLLNKSLRSYSMIYRDVEMLCISRYAEQSALAKVLYHELDNWLSNEVSPKTQDLLRCITPESSEEISKTLIHLLATWKQKLELLLQLFLYLDQSYLKGHPKKACIEEYGLQGIMRNLSLDGAEEEYGLIKQSAHYLVVVLLSKVRKGRVSIECEKLARELLSQIFTIDVANRSSLEHAIEKSFMSDYRIFQNDWMQDKTNYVVSFLIQLSDDASFLSSAGIEQSFTQRLVSSVKWKYLLSDMERYVKSSFPTLLESGNERFSSTVIQFCDNSMKDYAVDTTAALIKFWKDFILLRLSEVTSGDDIVPGLIRLWNELEKICTKTFQQEKFGFELRNAVLNYLAAKDVSLSVIVQLLKYCDSFMKQSHISDEDYQRFENDVLVIFKLISNKADFTTSYEKTLSKRMLLSRHFDLCMEKKLVDRFVLVIGASDENSNLRAMIRDYETSKSSLRHLDVSASSGFNALVLERKYWPDFSALASDLKLPPAFKQPLEQFEMQYKLLNSKNKYHNLDWKNFALHQIVLEVSFDAGPKQLYVNLLQAAVLLLFEDKDRLSFDSMLEATNLDSKTLGRILASLESKRYPILIRDNNTVFFNSSFTDKLSKIRLPLGKERDTLKLDDISGLTIKGRSSEIRSAIVRIMKDQKSLPHPALLGKVIEALKSRGLPLIVEIKVQLENLISNEFVRRDGDGTTLHYVP